MFKHLNSLYRLKITTCTLFNKRHYHYSDSNLSYLSETNLTKSQLMFMPGKKVSKRFMHTNLNSTKDVLKYSELTISYVRRYLVDTKGVFSKFNYSSIVIPKSSTKKSSAGISRDQRRSLLSKLSNYFMLSGLSATSIKALNKALLTVNTLSKSDKNSDLYNKYLSAYNSLVFLNSAYKNTNLPIISNLIDSSNNSIPRFFIKKHISKLPGRKKNKTKGKPPVRSYLAFIKPHGRNLLSLKLLVSDFKKMSANSKFSDKLIHLIINNILNLNTKSYSDKKIQTYKSIIAFLKGK